MDEQQVLVDCWRLVEKHGHTPTIKGVMRMAREVGASFDEHWARGLLRPFLKKATPLPPRSNPEATPQNEHDYPEATPIQPRSVRGTRARGKGTPSSQSLFQEATPPANGKPSRPDTRSTAEKDADTAIALLRPRVEPLLSGMTWTAWRSQNRRTVVDMVRAGMTPEAIDAAHDEIRDGAGRPFLVMAWFQNRLTARSIASGVSGRASPRVGEVVNRELR